jgi:hypothetical protein
VARVRRFGSGWKVLSPMLVYLVIGAALGTWTVVTGSASKGPFLSGFAIYVAFWPVFVPPRVRPLEGRLT